MGRDLISAAAVRAQISQIEKYQTAVNTFKGKYAYLPGDIPDPYASNFGFAARGALPGQGDGNGVIEFYFPYHSPPTSGANAYSGEQGMVWADLAKANLIAGTFGVAYPTLSCYGCGAPAGVLPPALIGQNNYIGISSSGGSNYFYIALTTGTQGGGQMIASPGLTVSQAFKIDAKIDDGLPRTGNVTTDYLACCSGYADSPSAASPSSSTCYDSTSVNYSITQNNGSGMNCALSFKFQ